MPTTRSAGRPQASRMTQTMTSSGLVMVMTKACGQWVLIAAPTVATILALVPIRSSRLMPGRRAMPAVTMTMSAPLRSA